MKKETWVEMKSPLTGGRVKEVFDVEDMEFRGETYSVHVRYYVCEDSGQEFTAGAQDDLFCNDLYDQYRVRHGFPFPDEIKSLRERYGLNYTQMGKILGFGMNQWKSYEDGSVPSESNARLILAVRDRQGMMEMVKTSRCEFSDKEFERVCQKVSASNESAHFDYMQKLLFGNTTRGSLNGFSQMNVPKLAQMVRYLIDREGGDVCPTKLNKSMFYADFGHYRQYGRSISGLSYRAIKYGPVPEHFDTIYDNIDGVEKVSILQYDTESVRLRLAQYADRSVSMLDEQELSTLATVSARIGPLKTQQVVELSHKEKAWLDNVAGHALIDYSFAFELIDNSAGYKNIISR